MPLFGKYERIRIEARRSASEKGAIARLRWREPCAKIIVIGNLVFATITSAQIGLSATLKPWVRIEGSNGFQITSQVKMPCKTGHRTLFYGFDFFTIIKNTYVAKGVICRDVGGGKWVWQFADPKFSNYNSE